MFNSEHNSLGKIPFWTALVLGALLLSAMTGCSSKRYSDYEAFVKTPRPLVTTDVYRMSPPDAIQIVSRRVREIDSHRERIRPDGRITLPLLGSVFVAGKTCEQVSAELQHLASEYYEDADVSIRVTDFASKRVFVFGEVTRPGAFPYTGSNTILEMLAQSYPTRLADPDRIHVFRPTPDGQIVKRMTVSLDDMVKDGDTTLNAVLTDGDIIYVPANGFAATGLAIQQLLLPLTPAASLVQNPVSIHSTFQSEPYQSDGNNNNNN